MADLRLYVNIKASLAQTLVNILEDPSLEADPLYHLIEWDVSNTHPRQALPDVKDATCKYRARAVVTAVGDAAVGDYVSKQIMKPILLVTVYSKDPTASNYLLSVIKRSLDDLPIVRVTSVDLDCKYDTAINCHSGNIMLTVNMGSTATLSGRSLCDVKSPQISACPGLELPSDDLTLRYP